MHLIRRRLRTPALPLLVTFALAVAAPGCGDDDGPATSSGPTTDPDEAVASCDGEPIPFTTINSLSGPLAFGSNEVQINNGIEAALHAVNGECTLGRPIEVHVCDDRSDPNEATACARQAAQDGSLAFLGAASTFPGAPEAAGVPGVYLAGGSQFDITSEQALSVASGLDLILGSVSGAKAAGVENYLMISFDNALMRFGMPIIEAMAAEQGVNLEPLWYPPQTTDFAPIAAQVRERDPDAIGLVVSSALPMMNALADEGISATDIPIFTSVALMPPEVVRQLGDVAEGMYLITQQVPPSHDDNEGIAQMREEFEAAGLDPDDADLGPVAVQYWSDVHLVADALAQLTPEQIESLDSATVFGAVEAFTPVTRPEIAPADFSQTAYPDIEALAPFRLYSGFAMALHVEDGEYVQVSPFVDVTTPFEMEFDS